MAKSLAFVVPDHLAAAWRSQFENRNDENFRNVPNPPSRELEHAIAKKA
jgi:hypothetical protein